MLGTSFYVTASTLAVIFFVIALIVLLHNLRSKSSTLSGNLFVKFLMPFFSAIWIFQFERIFFFCQQRESDLYGMNLWDVIMTSISKTFLIFSLDDGNGSNWNDAVVMFHSVIPSEAAAIFFTGFVSVLTVVAPIVGGAIILDILCNVFPKFKFCLQMGREKYVFSELNANTLALANSIRNNRLRVTIVFTAVSDSKNETEMKRALIREAKNIGAICVKEDVTNFKIYGSSSVKYILMNRDNDLKDIDDMTELIVRYPVLCSSLLRSSENSRIDILLFSTDNSIGNVVKGLYTGENKERYRLKENNVAVIVINEYLRLAYSLLEERPLYQIIDPKATSNKISVMVVGCGRVGTEILRAAYWCGQFGLHTESICIDKFPLEIHVVDLRADEVRTRLIAECPEIDFSDRENGNGTFFFHAVDALSAKFRQMLDKNADLCEANYVVVATGDDLQNIDIAHMLYRELTVKDINYSKKRMINYIVADRTISDTLNASNDSEKRLYAFGHPENQYCLKNILAYEVLKEEMNALSEKHGDTDKFENLISQYDRRSNTAAILFYSYKKFMVGINPDDSVELMQEKLQLNYDYLGWIEHERWNAYVRALGYRRATEGELDFICCAPKFSLKDEILRIHGALVSAKQGRGIRSLEEWSKAYDPQLDELDNVSLKRNKTIMKEFEQHYPENFQYLMNNEILTNYRREYFDLNSDRTEENRQKIKENAISMLELELKDKKFEDEEKPDFNMIKMLIFPTDYKQYDYDQIEEMCTNIQRMKQGG